MPWRERVAHGEDGATVKQMIEISHMPLVQYRPLTVWFGFPTLF